MGAGTSSFLAEIWAGLRGDAGALPDVEFVGEGALPSVFAVADFASATIAACGLAIRELVASTGGVLPKATVDRKLASLWFAWSLQPIGWELPSPWDPVAGDYPTSDGWIRLHTNAPRHRTAALAVLDALPEREAVARAVAGWNAEALQEAVVDAGGCAACMYRPEQWDVHPQGVAVGREPLVQHDSCDGGRVSSWRPNPSRPLRGLKVLDLTRVLAGPVATRFLAGFGADVLRIDPPGWDEPAVVPDVTLGKRCARLDLRERRDRAVFEALLRDADVLVHGYRADALESLGFGARRRHELCPGLVDVCLNAYGWSGPWRGRRGFDSLVQMSAGIAHEGMRLLSRHRPTPLPVQALDHGTGYLMAAAVIRGLTDRLHTARGQCARLSLARTARLLNDGPRAGAEGPMGVAAPDDWGAELEQGGFGPARRLRGPLSLGAVRMQWDRPAGPLGSSPPAW